MNHVIINPENPDFYYSLFYLTAIIVGFAILLFEGRRRKFPMISWMMVIATAFLFFMAGCRVIAFTEREWAYVLRFESIPYGTARSVLGGIVFSIPGILIARKFLRFNVEMTDAFAFVLPLALVVQRFGCLAAGCCYGTPSKLPWAIQYTDQSPVYGDHLQNGQIAFGSLLTAPVHPVQIYEIICAAFIVLILLRLRSRLYTPGSLYLTSFALYGAFRFCLEFFRASAGHTIGGSESYGLTSVQWVALVVVPTTVLIILFRERYWTESAIKVIKQSIFRQALYAVMFAMLFVAVAPWLGKDEIISINMIVVPMVALIAWRLYASITVPGLRLASLMLPIASLSLMSQTYPEPSEGKKSYTTVSFGLSGGNTDMKKTETSGGYTSGGGCDGGGTYVPQTTIVTTDKNAYSMGSIGIARTVQSAPEESFTFGISASSGTHRESFNQTVTSSGAGTSSRDVQNNYSYLFVKPYVQFDHRDFGLGLGLSMGEMGELSQNFDNSTVVRKSQVLPSVSVRTGRLSKFFVEYRFNNQFAPGMPAMTHQGSIGIGLGKGYLLRLGTGSYTSLIIAPYLPVGKNFVLEPYVGFGGGINKWESPGTFVGSLSLHYKFGRK